MDRLKKSKFTWQPYTDKLVSTLSAFCVADRDLWRVVVPFIFFHIVEWHQPYRVMRQFGFNQPIPRAPHQLDHLHIISLKGMYDEYWLRVHKQYIAIWDSRHDHVTTGEPLTQLLGTHSEYMRWYKQVTKRWITPIAAIVVDTAKMQYSWTTPEGYSAFTLTAFENQLPSF